MEKFIIRGGTRLSGEIEVEASKNSILPIISASLLTEEEVVINNVPEITDLFKMFEILRNMGGKVFYN